jgi:hypothetical protein
MQGTLPRLRLNAGSALGLINLLAPDQESTGIVLSLSGTEGSMVPAARSDTDFNLRGKMTKKRGSAYYRGVIQRKFPALYADILSGKKTVRQASIEAKLRRQPTRGDALIRNYERASPADRRQFGNWLRARSAGKTTTAPIVDSSGKLVPAVIVFIRDWLRKPRKTPGHLLSKIGKHSNHDIRMSRALKGDRLPPEFLAGLEVWLRGNGYA